MSSSLPVPPPPSNTLPAARWWLWPAMLSLEAPLVALGWQAALAHTHQLRLPGVYYWGLALLTWVLYALDRIADATTAGASSLRHQFHARYRRLFLWLVLPAAITALGYAALWELPEPLLWQGLALVLLALIYLSCFAAAPRSRARTLMLAGAAALGIGLVMRLPVPTWLQWVLGGGLTLAAIAALQLHPDSHQSLRMPKELLASLLFMMGCSAGVHHWTGGEHGIFCTESLLLWAVGLLNLLSISCAEVRHGMEPSPGSLLRWQPGVAEQLSLFAMLLVIASTAVIFSAIDQGLTAGAGSLAAYSLVAAVLLLGLNARGTRLSPETFRALADLSVLLPLPLVWLV